MTRPSPVGLVFSILNRTLFIKIVTQTLAYNPDACPAHLTLNLTLPLAHVLDVRGIVRFTHYLLCSLLRVDGARKGGTVRPSTVRVLGGARRPHQCSIPAGSGRQAQLRRRLVRHDRQVSFVIFDRRNRQENVSLTFFFLLFFSIAFTDNYSRQP